MIKANKHEHEKLKAGRGSVGKTPVLGMRERGGRTLHAIQSEIHGHVEVGSTLYTAEHPTQKPVGILRTLLDYSCPPKGIVLDVFAGSGSTLLAAAANGCRAIGVEIEEQYCEIAAKRLAQEVMQFQ